MRKWFMDVGIYWTPYCLYVIGLGLIISCIWERGKDARRKLGLFGWFCATTILLLMVLWGR